MSGKTVPECPACRVNVSPHPDDPTYKCGQHAAHLLLGVHACAELGVEGVRNWLCPAHRACLEQFKAAGR